MRYLRSKPTFNIWPGFVDVLSGLLMAMLFALVIFVLAQVYLTDALSLKDKSLGNLRQALQELSQALGKEKKQTSLLTTQKEHALLQAEALREEMAQLNEQLLRLNGVLQTSEQTVVDKKLQIDHLGAQLQDALEEKLKELSAYRSEFFGKLKQALGKRDDIRVVGDRFVFQSEVLFKLGSDHLGKDGEKKLIHLAHTLKEIAAKIPDDLHWVLRVDGHTDTLPIKTSEFKSNWELSTARAVSVVKFLIHQGVSPHHLAAAGFGEFHPLDAGVDAPSFARNRRIELKLDQR